MDQVKACRICLVTGVKMFDLRTYPMVNYFESITGCGLSPPDTLCLPPYVCYECAARLKNTFLFRENCIKGQSTLFKMFRLTGKISEKDIESVDRVNLNLCSKIKIALQSSCSGHVINITHEEPEICEVKDEPSNGEVEDEKTDMQMDFFKEEEVEFSGVLSPAPYTSDDDDEPLSFHKTNKEEVKKKPEKKKVRKRKQADVDVKDEDESREGTSEAEVISESKDESEKVVQRRKRGRPRKKDAASGPKKDRQPSRPPKESVSRRTKNTGGVEDNDIDLEEYVTVIKLTKEEQLEEIKKRQHSSNYLNAPYKCTLCYKGFIDTDAWKHHITKHTPTPGDLECAICKFRFKTKRNLQKHSSNHEKKYACKSCPYVSKTTTQAKQHQRWHKGVTYKCQYCDEVSTKWTSYLSHVRIKHPSEFICGVCGYSFVSQLGLNMHKTMMHKQLQDKDKKEKDDTGPYCAVCDVKFVSMEAYRRHMVTSIKHTQNNDFKNGCRVCGETFATGEELRVHHRRLHARQRPKNYGKKPANTAWPADCEHCSESIANARDYWTHFRRAHPDKPYPIQKNYICDICGKSFRGNAFLVYHKRTHTEERAYKCAQCPKAFFNRTNLQMHEKTHSDHRPYPCTVCFKAFKCKGALDRHFRSHTGVKPYECEVCGKAFCQSNSRKLHVRTVHLKQPAPYVSRARLARAKPAPDPPPYHALY